MSQVPAPARKPKSFAYNPALDGVRAVAILGVMFFHAGLHYGGRGVFVFYVLSGFLISSLLLTEWFRNGRINLGAFYLRRFLRLYPALLLLLVVTVAVIPVFIRVPTPSALGVVSVLLYFSNWNWTLTGSGELGYLTQLWSLAVEEQFYLIWPAVMIYFLSRRNASRNLIVAAVVVACLSLLARVVLGSDDPLGHRRLGTDAQADQLMLGCALAVMVARYPRAMKVVVRRLIWPALVTIVAILAVWPFVLSRLPLGYVWSSLDMTVFGLASATVIGYLYFANPLSIAARIMGFGPIVLVGRISYGLYLWHYPVFVIVWRWFHSRSAGPGELLLEFGITFAVAGLSFVLLERPLLRLKDRFKPRVARETRTVDALSEARA